MDIHTVISTFQTVLHQHAGMGYFVDLLLKSLFVLVLMAIINLFTRKLAASLRHLVWCIGFISLLSLPLFIGFIPKIQVPITASEIVILENTVTRGIVSIADNINLLLGAWWNAFLGIYLSLLLFQVLYTLMGLCKVYSLSRAAGEVENPYIRWELENLILEEGLTVSVGLLKSREIFSPLSWGLFRPEIILPEQAESWGPEKIRNVLIHELSHIQRLDWLTSLIVRISTAIYWYNPLVWYAARKLNEEAEQACDDAVLLYGHCHNEYASNLLEIASHARLGRLGNVIAQAIAGSFLGSRVFSILDTDRKRQKTELVWVVRAILISFTVIAILASLRLVPMVNVSSIDPNASSAFSVIFIPSAKAKMIDDDVAILSDTSGNEQQNRRGNLQTHVKTNILSNNQTMAETTRESVNGGSSGGFAANQADAADHPGLDLAAEAHHTSLIEDFINATGMKDSKAVFDSYIDEYTSSIIRSAESGIDLSGFPIPSQDNQFADEKRDIIAIRKKQPVYPVVALRRGIEGYSIVEYEIDSKGRVINPVIVDSRPGTVFNRSSLEAIQQYSFKPPKINGEVVSLKGLQTKFIYQLKSG